MSLKLPLMWKDVRETGLCPPFSLNRGAGGVPFGVHLKCPSSGSGAIL